MPASLSNKYSPRVMEPMSRIKTARSCPTAFSLLDRLPASCESQREMPAQKKQIEVLNLIGEAFGRRLRRKGMSRIHPTTHATPIPTAINAAILENCCKKD